MNTATGLRRHAMDAGRIAPMQLMRQPERRPICLPPKTSLCQVHPARLLPGGDDPGSNDRLPLNGAPSASGVRAFQRKQHNGYPPPVRQVRGRGHSRSSGNTKDPGSGSASADRSMKPSRDRHRLATAITDPEPGWPSRSAAPLTAGQTLRACSWLHICAVQHGTPLPE
jgi:hypothetical protein